MVSLTNRAYSQFTGHLFTPDLISFQLFFDQGRFVFICFIHGVQLIKTSRIGISSWTVSYFCEFHSDYILVHKAWSSTGPWTDLPHTEDNCMRILPFPKESWSQQDDVIYLPLVVTVGSIHESTNTAHGIGVLMLLFTSRLNTVNSVRLGLKKIIHNYSWWNGRKPVFLPVTTNMILPISIGFTEYSQYHRSNSTEVWYRVISSNRI